MKKSRTYTIKTTKRKIIDPFIDPLPHLDIHGETSATCVAVINSFIRDNLKLHKMKIVIVHGKGTGKLRDGIHSFLKKHPHVESFRMGNFGEGEMGVTVVTLK